METNVQVAVLCFPGIVVFTKFRKRHDIKIEPTKNGSMNVFIFATLTEAVCKVPGSILIERGTV